MYLVVLSTLLVFAVIYLYVSKKNLLNSLQEDFTNSDRPGILDEWTKMIPYWNRGYNPDFYKLIEGQIYTPQGTPLPLKGSPLLLESSKDIPTVDGTPNAPRSLAVFAFNKARPECCSVGNGGYSTSGGCVCVTKQQDKWFGDVAGNRRYGYMGM